MEEKNHRVYLAIPAYDGHIESTLVPPIYQSYKYGMVDYHIRGHSLLAYNFNMLWYDAINNREKEGYTHFAMIHSDITPQDDWLKIMLEELEKYQGDVISAVSPIKSTQGLTSTGIQINVDDHPWAVRRLTLSEIHELPETFTDEHLVINTGLFVADIRKPWAEKICFTIKDRIRKKPDGKYQPQVLSEDWAFSMQVRELGGKLLSTRKVELRHYGRAGFVNSKAWGSEKEDPAWTKNKTDTSTDKLEILTYPAHKEILTTPCEDVNFPEFDSSIFDRMIEAMIGWKYQKMVGVGLAAPQIGISKKFFIMSPKARIEEIKRVVNPSIVRHGKSVLLVKEGCMSFPGELKEIPRYEIIDVIYFTEKGVLVRETLKRWEAVVFQHEFDHIQGTPCMLKKFENT